MRPGTCLYCSCTDAKGCAAGCEWVDEPHTLCSECEHAMTVAKLFVDAPHQARHEVPPRWEDRPLRERRAHVMITRHILENLERIIETRLEEDELVAGAELVRLATALRERYPADVDRALETESSIVDVVLALLGEKRIVLAG